MIVQPTRGVTLPSSRRTEGGQYDIGFPCGEQLGGWSTCVGAEHRERGGLRVGSKERIMPMTPILLALTNSVLKFGTSRHPASCELFQAKRASSVADDVFSMI